MKIFPYSCVPADHPEYHNQADLMDISDEEFDSQWKNHHYEWYHRVYQVICFFLFLGPIRLVVCIGGFFLMNLFVAVGRYIQLKLTNNNHNIMKKFFYNCLYVSIKFVSMAFGTLRIRIHGSIDPESRVLISNHTAFHDPFIVSFAVHCSIVCKYELSQIWLMRYMIDCLDPIYVRRDKSVGQAQLVLERANATDKLPVLIFPEGTLNAGDISLKYHKSAFLSDHKVQPVLVRYNQPLVPKGWNSFAWVQNNLWEYCFMCLSMPFNFIDIYILEPMTMKENGGNPEEFAKEAQLRVSNFFGVKATTRSSDEIFKARRAARTESNNTTTPTTTNK